MTLREVVADAGSTLLEGPHPERARLDAEVLLRYVLRQSRGWLLAHWEEALDPEKRATFTSLVARRRTGEPMQHITGETEFYGLPFSVTKDVLIPRQETEHLVQEVLHLIGSLGEMEIRIADIGTGSGAIAVALAHSLPHASLTATDLSAKALLTARSNTASNHLADRIEFLQGDLLAPLGGSEFEIIASNPPYVPLAELDSLAIEVRDHEPHLALFAGDDGLAIYRRLIPEALQHLTPGGWLVLEIGYGQQPAIDALLRENGYAEIHFVPDYQDIPRVAAGRKP